MKKLGNWSSLKETIAAMTEDDGTGVQAVNLADPARL